MKGLLVLASVCFLMICNGCGDTHESLAKDAVATMKEMNTVLDGVKDEATAKAAKPQLKSLMEKMKAINEKQEKLGIPTDADLKAMEGSIGKEMEEVQQKFTTHMLRIMVDPKIQAELHDIAGNMQK